MRYLVMVKYNENAVPPPQALLDALAKNRQEAKLAGVLVAVGGLFPSAVGARVRLTGEEEKVEEEKVSGTFFIN